MKQMSFHQMKRQLFSTESKEQGLNLK